MNKRLRNTLQNLALALLTLSALFLITRLPVFHLGWAGRFQSLLTSHPAESGYSPADEAGGTFPSVHIMVTGDSEYGRYGQLYATAGDPLLQQILPLFQEALGSAAEVGAAAEKTLRDALDAPSLHLDLTTRLPLAAVALWLGEETEIDREVRSMSLTAGEGDTATLYLRGDTGEIYRCETALPASALQAVCDAASPNNSCFAYETNYDPLAPYTVLTDQAPQLRDISAGLPAGYTAYNLLTALDFNAHTLFRYQESSGTEVVEESPRTLRISPDGTVSYSTRGDVSASLYRVSSAGEVPTLQEALAAAWRLAGALTDGAGASSLTLRAVDIREDGCRIAFRYQVEGIPVFFPDEGDALSVTISGTAITAFAYRCRLYTAEEDLSPLLPAGMARAIASLHPGAGLSLGYVDGITGQISAQWLAR
ncbi:MAG: hypothetical protein HFF67_04880 [Oscillospiraceae bacterium]|nr:hypothetical protein [Oscillospiraceae bacterium]